MKKRTFYLLLVALLVSGILSAQNIKVAGVVYDKKTGDALIGATVMQKGTSNGTITDLDGKFSFAMPAGSTLLVSYVGYISQEQIVETSEQLRFLLVSNTESLEEVVVVGYGTSRVKDLTAPVTVIKAEDLMRRTTGSAMGSLQGSAAGVQVITNGSPGSSPTVRIRGVGSLNNESPLYVVDGMFFDNIDFLNTNDISEMTILKDASAAAIYGVRAANGVVLITTKKGTLNAKTRITYDGYIGFQTPAHMLQMANGQEYATMELAKGTTSDVAHVTLSSQKFGGSGNNPTTSTDWYGELLKKSALTQNHSLDISGGSDKTTYTVALSYLYQDGIMNANNNYKRFNLLAQTDFQANSWLKIGYKMLLSNSTLFSPNKLAFANAYYASPLYPVYDATNTNAFPTDYATSTSIGYANGAFSNPVATANYYYDKTNGFQLSPTVFAEISLWKDKLLFKTQYSQKYTFNNNLNYIQAYYVDAYQLSANQKSLLTSYQEKYQNYIIDNTLTYKDGINRHHWSAMIGQSTRNESWRQLKGTASNVPGAKEEYMYLSQGDASGRTLSEDGTDYHGLSFFGRATYDFASRYLLTATFRADGSSKYQQKWGYFPSIGAGWIISEEKFMTRQSLLEYLKVRFSWGMLGNDAIPSNNGFSSLSTGSAYSGIYGSTSGSAGAYIPGYIAQNFFNYLKWEVVSEWDGGIDFSMLNQRLKGSVDYYNRQTDNLVFYAPQPMGVADLLGNYGKVSNKGLELTLNWSDKIEHLGYSVGGNISTLNNKVLDLHGLAYKMTGVAEFPTRMEVGEPVNSFYGYQAIGVYQTTAEVNADPVAITNNLLPGDLKYKDQNGDKIIDSKDRVMLGNYLPKLSYGFNFGLNYNQFELNVMFQGQAGNKILNMNRARRLWYSDMNGDAEMITHLWTAEGSTNQYPSALATTKGWNNLASSFFVEDGSYVRIQNIQLAYSFKLTRVANAPFMRIYVTADRPVIFTKYSGFTPEIGGTKSDLSGTGYDNNVYPASATYSIGLRITY
ncbi:MAG: TonB-dependent receptor [Paludibacter sp.]|nr:TonB-dependent receptor [Paludibacter sp.]